MQIFRFITSDGCFTVVDLNNLSHFCWLVQYVTCVNFKIKLNPVLVVVKYEENSPKKAGAEYKSDPK